jgi:leucyl aminopeptidase
MITIQCAKANFNNHQEGYVVFCTENEHNNKHVTELTYSLGIPLADIMQKRGFQGKAGSLMELCLFVHGRALHLIFLGIGSSQKEDRLEDFRRAIGNAVRCIEASKISHVGIFLPEPEWFGVSESKLAQEVSATTHIAAYHFDDFLEEKAKSNFTLELYTSSNAIQEGMKRGEVIAAAVNQARYWIDLPSHIVTPTYLAQRAQEIAQNNNLTLKIFSNNDYEKLGMGGLKAVSQGSHNESNLIIMEYLYDTTSPTIALVGKGVTFDSGGYNIKSSTAMRMMKIDMAGAGAVLATMEALAKLKPQVNVIGVLPLAENVVSSMSMKPGDIIRFYNGKTAEIKDTDAEGRLILADALSYVTHHYKLDLVVTIATLTYACIEALGHFFSGLMTYDNAWAEIFLKAGLHSGDRTWRLPLHKDYEIAIKSEVADLCNIGNVEKYRAEATTAALFLKHFTGKTPFVHLDIAGTAFDVPDISYYRSGTTGVGVRLFIELLTRHIPF